MQYIQHIIHNILFFQVKKTFLKETLKQKFINIIFSFLNFLLGDK